jgi:hypothetical protein
VDITLYQQWAIVSTALSRVNINPVVVLAVGQDLVADRACLDAPTAPVSTGRPCLSRRADRACLDGPIASVRLEAASCEKVQRTRKVRL